MDLKKINKDVLIELIKKSDESQMNVGLQAAITSLTKSIDTLQENLANYKKEQIETSETVISLVVANRKLEDRVLSLEGTVNAFEQRSRINNVEIVGLTGKTDEENEGQAIELFKNLGVKVDPMQIEACHAVQTRRKDKRSLVICAFTNRKLKEQILAKRKDLSKQNAAYPVDKKIFVSEHLSPVNKRIFISCLARKKLPDGRPGSDNPARIYKYVWTKKGVTLLRINDGDKVIRVDSVQKVVELGIELATFA